MGRPQDFSKSVIYHIRHMESKEVVYVGSTSKFPQRKAKHKYDYNKGKHFTIPIYCHIRDNGGFNCFEIIPIKLLKLENKTELLIAEQEEINRHRTLVNSCKAHRTIEEHKEYDKKYREEHKEEHKEYSKQYYHEHKEIINEKNKEYQKEYREEHKDIMKEYFKQYYHEHKENINEKRKKYYQEHKQPVKCPICNSVVTQGEIKRHQRTKKCQEYLNK
jgi:flagellar biosynthesis GTPase FlhF